MSSNTGIGFEEMVMGNLAILQKNPQINNHRYAVLRKHTCQPRQCHDPLRTVFGGKSIT